MGDGEKRKVNRIKMDMAGHENDACRWLKKGGFLQNKLIIIPAQLPPLATYAFGAHYTIEKNARTVQIKTNCMSKQTAICLVLFNLRRVFVALTVVVFGYYIVAVDLSSVRFVNPFLRTTCTYIRSTVCFFGFSRFRFVTTKSMQQRLSFGTEPL